MTRTNEGEKKNSNVCPGCGRVQELNPASFVNTCVCGQRITGEQTPPIENLDNLCRVCLHPLDPEHDAFGCHIPGCSCTVQGGAIHETRDVLPNASMKAPWYCDECSKKLQTDADVREHKSATGHSSYRPAQNENAVDAPLAVRIWGVAAPEDRATWARDAGVVLPQSGLPAAFSDFAPDAQEKLLSLFSTMSTPAAAPGSAA
jgi:hypothetical protein